MTNPPRTLLRNTLGRRITAALLTIALVATAAFSALPSVGAQTASSDVTNAVPSITSTTLYSAAPTPGSACVGGTSAASFTPTQNSTTTIHICSVVSDNNGWNDVCAVGSSRTYTVLFWDGVSTVGSKTGSLDCASGSGANVAVTANFTMEYWRFANAGYSVSINVQDIASASASNSATFAYQTLTSLRMVNASISFGSLAPGAVSQRQAVALNEGNVNFTINAGGPGSGFAGTTHGQSIAVGSLQHGTAFNSETVALTGTPSGTSVNAGTESSTTSTGRTVFLKFTVPMPAGNVWTPQDTYSGTLTFAAAAS